VPQQPALSEAGAADAEGFLTDLLLCLRIVGVSFFEKPKAGSATSHDLVLKAKGIEARGIDGADGFVVRAGTLAEQGVLVDSGESYRLAQDYPFNSPSTAAGVLLGRSANGRLEWKDARGRSLKEIQEAAAGG